MVLCFCLTIDLLLRYHSLKRSYTFNTCIIWYFVVELGAIAWQYHFEHLSPFCDYLKEENIVLLCLLYVHIINYKTGYSCISLVIRSEGTYWLALFFVLAVGVWWSQHIYDANRLISCWYLRYLYVIRIPYMHYYILFLYWV